MGISSLLYTIGQGFRNIRRNSLFTLASMATIASCLFLFGLFYAIILNFQHIVQSPLRYSSMKASPRRRCSS